MKVGLQSLQACEEGFDALAPALDLGCVGSERKHQGETRERARDHGTRTLHRDGAPCRETCVPPERLRKRRSALLFMNLCRA